MREMGRKPGGALWSQKFLLWLSALGLWMPAGIVTGVISRPMLGEGPGPLSTSSPEAGLKGCLSGEGISLALPAHPACGQGRQGDADGSRWESTGCTETQEPRDGGRPSPAASASIPAVNSQLQPDTRLSNTHLAKNLPAARPALDMVPCLEPAGGALDMLSPDCHLLQRPLPCLREEACSPSKAPLFGL